MTTTAGRKIFETWFAELQLLAKNEGCEWIISSKPDDHRKAFDSGFSPADEFESLQKVCAWDGCGCGM